jgi:cation transport ATPase
MSIQSLRQLPRACRHETYNRSISRASSPIWKGSSVRAGNPFWLDIASHPSVASLLAGGLTLLCVLLDGRPVMSFSLKASLRVEAVSVIKELSTRGITCHVVSGHQPTCCNPHDDQVSQKAAKEKGHENRKVSRKATPICHVTQE